MPLGVLGGAVGCEPVSFTANDYQSVVLFSDGITEAERADGQMYGEDTLIAKIESTPNNQSVFEPVKNDVEQFMNGAMPNDDISFIVLDL